jgi:hypothetical protein
MKAKTSLTICLATTTLPLKMETTYCLVHHKRNRNLPRCMHCYVNLLQMTLTSRSMTGNTYEHKNLHIYIRIYGMQNFDSIKHHVALNDSIHQLFFNRIEIEQLLKNSKFAEYELVTSQNNIRLQEVAEFPISK